MRRVLWMPLLLLAGCDGCGAKRGETAAAAAVSKADPLVFDVQASALVELQSRLSPLIDAVVTDAQIDQLRQELVLGLGFDPSRREGLVEAGLNPEARWAGGFDGEQLLLVLPATDVEKARGLVASALERRFGNVVKADGRTRFERSFGPEKIEAAAIGVREGLLIVAFGQGATERVAQAQDLAPDESAAELLPASGTELARVRTPDPQAGARRLLEGLPEDVTAGLDEEKVGAIIASLRRTALDLRALDSGLRVSAESAFEGAEAIDPYVAAKGPLPAELQALASEKAVIGLRLALGPKAIFDALLPPNSPGRRALEDARSQSRLRFDFEKEVLPLLSGHLAIALGASDLREVPFGQIVGDPLSVSWVGIGVGTVEDADLLKPFAAQLASDPRIKVKTRQVEDLPVSTFLLGETRVVEAADTEGALLFGTDPGVLDRVLTADSDAGPAVPFALSIRFDPLEEVARSFPGSKLPLVFRGLWARMLDGLGALQVLEARVVRESDTVQMTVDLLLDPPEDEAAR